MADRVFNEVRGMGRELVVLPLAFSCNNTSAPTVRTTNAHGVASVTRTGVGTYLVTLQDAYPDFRAIQVSVKSTAGTPVVAHAMVGAVDTVSAKTIQVYTVNSSGAIADFSTANAIEVHVVAVLKNGV